MKLAVGYPVTGAEDIVEAFVEAIEDNLEHVEEVYFALPGDPSGRTPCSGGELPAAALTHLRSLGVKLDLLFNANCYGPGAAGAPLANHIRRQVASTVDLGGVDVVTTTSPFIAKVLRDSFPQLERRASVNMRIGTVAGMEMIADLFDGFYVQRDYNRDLKRLARLRDWCIRNGKRLCGLVNSGCLAFCPGQTFHDNLVAHEANTPMRLDATLLPCRRHLSDERNLPSVLSATWIRPEDVHHYAPFFDVAKLATRMHAAPERVIRAYAAQRYRGNLLDLLEPGYTRTARGLWLDNAAFPDDWFERTTSCRRECERCGYCASVLERTRAPSRGPHPTIADHAFGGIVWGDQ